MEKLLTTKDIAMSLHVSPQLVYKWVEEGHVPHFKLGTLVRFRESEVARWVSVKRRRGRSSRKLDVDKIMENQGQLTLF